MNLNFGNSLAGRAGGGVGRPDHGSSFLPEDYLRRKRDRRHNFIALVLFKVVMFAVIAAFFVTNRQWNSVKAQQQDINEKYTAENKKIEQLKVLEAQKQEMMEKAEITAALIERVPRSILLAELINRMPEELTLTDLKLTGKRVKEAPPPEPKDKAGAKPKPRSLVAGSQTKPGEKDAKDAPPKPVPPKFDFTIELIGLSSTDAHVADFQAALKECPLLENVDLVYTGTSKVDDLERRKFRVEARIRPTADARNIHPLQVPRGDLATKGDVLPDGKPVPFWLRKNGLFGATQPALQPSAVAEPPQPAAPQAQAPQPPQATSQPVPPTAGAAPAQSAVPEEVKP